MKTYYAFSTNYILKVKCGDIMNDVMFENKTETQKMLFIAVGIAFASQAYINFMVSNFRISFAIILLPICLLTFKEVDFLETGLLSTIFVYILRVITYFIANPINDSVMLHGAKIYFPETFFYGGYSLFFFLFNRKNKIYNIDLIFLILIACDFFANSIEVLVRALTTPTRLTFSLFAGLLFIAIIRSLLAWIILNIMNQYKTFLMRKEHEDRYKKLLWMTSKLNSEVYWMEKSMDSIEKVMTSAYSLYSKISFNEDRDNWQELSVEIAKDIHEIKKDYGLVVRGVKSLTQNKLQDDCLSFYDIFDILKQKFTNIPLLEVKNIKFEFISGKNFFTTKHYFLMSVFRNLIMNAIDAVENLEEGKILFIHDEGIYNSENVHIFKVIDNGHGIENEDIEHIFSPGFSTKINYETGNVNRGLGLSIVSEIVKSRLKGDLKVNSTKEKGTTFTIYISKKVLEEVSYEDFNNRR